MGNHNTMSQFTLFSKRNSDHLLFSLESKWSNKVQCPLMKRYTSLMKWDNTYLGLQSLQPWSVYGDSNSFLMLNMREEKDCQKVAPFLQNLPTFKKRTHYFWYSKVTGAFPGGLWAQVLLSISLVQLFCMPNPKILSKLVNSAQNEKEITKICNGNL